MSSKQHQFSPHAIIEFTRHLFSGLSQERGGDTTLNELRIMNQIIICHLKGRGCSVTSLHEKTGIPAPTVSRIVTALQYSGWLCERSDPNDGRKRIISLSSDAVMKLNADLLCMVEWFRNFSEQGLPDPDCADAANGCG